MVCAGTYKVGKPSVVRTGIEPCVTEGWLEDDRQAADGWLVIREEMRHGVAAASRLWEFLACKADEWVHGNETSGDAWMNGR